MRVKLFQLCWKNWSSSFLDGIISHLNPGRSSNNYSSKCGELAGPYIEITFKTKNRDIIINHGDYIIKTEDQYYIKKQNTIFSIRDNCWENVYYICG